MATAVAAMTSAVSAGSSRAVKHAAMGAAGSKAAAVATPMPAATTTPAMPANAAAKAKAAAIGVAAPIPARTSPAIVIPAVIPATENELRVFDLRRVRQRRPPAQNAIADSGLRGAPRAQRNCRRQGDGPSKIA